MPGSGLQLPHAVRQQPQGTVQAHVLVDALHRAGTLVATVGGTTAQTALDKVFLRTVEHAPLILSVNGGHTN